MCLLHRPHPLLHLAHVQSRRNRVKSESLAAEDIVNLTGFLIPILINMLFLNEIRFKIDMQDANMLMPKTAFL